MTEQARAALAAMTSRAEAAERSTAALRGQVEAANARVKSLEVGAQFSRESHAELCASVAERDAVIKRLRDLNAGVAAERDEARVERDQQKSVAAHALKAAHREYRARLEAEARAERAEKQVAALGLTAFVYAGAKLLGGDD